MTINVIIIVCIALSVLGRSELLHTFVLLTSEAIGTVPHRIETETIRDLEKKSEEGLRGGKDTLVHIPFSQLDPRGHIRPSQPDERGSLREEREEKRRLTITDTSSI